jgi:glycosyltransferase involved in cell wall biosynthesis
MLSIIIPFYNEEKNLPILIDRLIDQTSKLKEEWEIILVDDGSTDAGASKLKVNPPAGATSDVTGGEKLKVFKHKKRLGKGKALKTGVENAIGETIIFMDADLQDDPKDLPKFLEKINEGYDLVNGWRKRRFDPWTKTLPSSIFNFLILRILLRSSFHDVNCGFKAVRREILKTVPLYGDNYRFLPIIAQEQGFKTSEVVVSHHRRRFGSSKFGFWRLFFGLFDTLTTYFIFKFSEKPLHFFGPVGGILFFIGFFITLILAIERIFFSVLLYRRPILFLGLLLIIVGVQIMMTGIIAELIVYLNKKNKR